MKRRRGASVRKPIGDAEYGLRIVKPDDFRV
jgi:hypothetical protein